MMNMKKWIIFTMVVIMLITVFGGCGEKNSVEEKEASSESSKNVEEKEITFWHSFTQPDRQAKMEEIVSEFEKQNPGVKVNIEVYPWSNFHTKWTTGLATQSLPDVSSALVSEVVLMNKADALIPMDKVVDSIGRDRFYQQPLDVLSFDNKVMALPYYTHSFVLWCREDVLEEKGIEIPTTWDELYEAAKAVNNPPDIYGMVMPMSKSKDLAAQYLYMVGKANGVYLLDENNNINLTHPKMVEAIEYLVKIYEDASPEGSINYSMKEKSDLWYQGKTVFDFNSGFHIDGVLKNSPELADKIVGVPIPKLTEDSEEVGGISSYITMVRWKSTKYPEVTQDFVEFLYDNENYIDFLHVIPGGMLPGLKDVGESEEFYEHPTIQKYKEDIENIQRGVEITSPMGMDFGANIAVSVISSQGIIEEMFQQIVINDVPIEEAAKDAEDKIKEAIKELE